MCAYFFIVVVIVLLCVFFYSISHRCFIHISFGSYALEMTVSWYKQYIYIYIYAENGHHSLHRKLQLICKYYILLTVQTSLARVTYIPKLFLPSSRIIVYDFVYFFFCSIRRRYCCCWWCFFIIYLIMCLSWSETGGPPNNYYVITQYLSFTINYERTMAKQKPS